MELPEKGKNIAIIPADVCLVCKQPELIVSNQLPIGENLQIKFETNMSPQSSQNCLLPLLLITITGKFVGGEGDLGTNAVPINHH